MRHLRILLLAALAVFGSVAAYANHYADFYVIPIAGHTPGVGGTNWMSDLAIQNFQTTPLTVEIVVIESGSDVDNVHPLTTANATGSVTVPPGGSVMLNDVLSGHRGMSSMTGALLVGSNRPFAVTSRSYSMTPSGDTVGQTVPGVGNFLDNTLSPIDLATAVAYVPGLVQTASFRTNMGFIAANGSGSGAPMSMTVTIRGANGNVLGTRVFAIPAGAIMQMQLSAREIAAANFDIGGAEFRITSGSGAVVPYASVIDNRTADAVFITGVFPQSTASATTAPAAAGNAAARSLFRSILERRRAVVD